jgi:hypothetical protein
MEVPAHVAQRQPVSVASWVVIRFQLGGKPTVQILTRDESSTPIKKAEKLKGSFKIRGSSGVAAKNRLSRKDPPYPLEEFIDRLAQHILKHYRHAVRYFGLFAPRAVHQMFDLIFDAIGHKRRPHPIPPRWADCQKRLSGQDPPLDRTGRRMYWLRRLAPQSEPAT